MFRKFLIKIMGVACSALCFLIWICSALWSMILSSEHLNGPKIVKCTDVRCFCINKISDNHIIMQILNPINRRSAPCQLVMWSLVTKVLLFTCKVLSDWYQVSMTIYGHHSVNLERYLVSIRQRLTSKQQH